MKMTCSADAVVMGVAPTFPDLHNLGEQRQRDIEKIVREFGDLFSSGKEDLGKVDPDGDTCHRIDLKPDSSPPTRYRAMSSYSQREIEFMEREVKMLLDLGIVKPSSSPWISAPVCVKKSSGELRLCIDSRPLNKCTIEDPYPLPLIDSLLRKMSTAKFITSVDIASAFWQIPMHSDHSKYTGFIMPGGKFEWAGCRSVSKTHLVLSRGLWMRSYMTVHLHKHILMMCSYFLIHGKSTVSTSQRHSHACCNTT
jgi:hypothetical protein